MVFTTIKINFFIGENIMSLASLKNNLKRLVKSGKTTNDGLTVKMKGENYQASDNSGKTAIFNVGVDDKGKGLLTSDKAGDQTIDTEKVSMVELRSHLIKAGLAIGEGRGAGTSVIKSLAKKKASSSK